jgi:hypothetical protein
MHQTSNDLVFVWLKIYQPLGRIPQPAIQLAGSASGPSANRKLQSGSGTREEMNQRSEIIEKALYQWAWCYDGHDLNGVPGYATEDASISIDEELRL